MAEHLLALGYEVHGLVRRVAFENSGQRMSRIAHLTDRITLHSGSLESYASLFKVVEAVQPDEVYHLGAQSFVSYSFDDPFSTFQSNINGTHYLLEAVRLIVPQCRFYFAGSSEMFGQVAESPQTEATKFHPRSPYGISKVTGFDLTRNYREAYGLFACSGILFNHESPRRGLEFVTRKITWHVAQIKHGKKSQLALGNLDALRDWGYAGDFVIAMHSMLQQPQPDDYVIATGETHSVREFCDLAFGHVGLNYEDYVVVDPKFYRPAEVHLLLGDASKARQTLGWQPRITFPQLVRMMVDHDLKAIADGDC